MQYRLWVTVRYDPDFSTAFKIVVESGCGGPSKGLPTQKRITRRSLHFVKMSNTPAKQTECSTNEE
jgi:hypothetical protein